MVIRAALSREFCRVRDFYYELIDNMSALEYRPGWQKGVYPADEMLREAIAQGELYIGCSGNEILSAMIVNTVGNESYGKGKWLTDAAPGEYMVIHALGVMPRHTRKGCAGQMVRFAMGLARSSGMKSLRLDVLGGNRSAERLYEGLGFARTDRIAMYYADTGWTDFLLYEYPLKEETL